MILLTGSFDLLLPHSTYFIRQFLVFVLFIGYCFSEIMCILDSYYYYYYYYHYHHHHHHLHHLSNRQPF